MQRTSSIETISLPVLGMTCAGCAGSVQSTINAQPGVEHAEVNYATQIVKVAYDPEKIQPTDFKKSLQSVGYDLIIDANNAKEKQEELVLKLPIFKKTNNRIRFTCCSCIADWHVCYGFSLCKLYYADLDDTRALCIW